MSMKESSELQAINTMLSCIGEAPINSMDGARSADTAIAANILEEVSREVQSRGWWFNTVFNQTLTMDVNGKVSVPQNWITVDHADYDYMKRGAYLFNRTGNTDVFTTSITGLEVMVWLEFVDLPEPARRYIVMRASRSFFERLVGEQGRAAMLQSEESQAYLSLLQFESEQADCNIFDNDYVTYQRRRSR